MWRKIILTTMVWTLVAGAISFSVYADGPSFKPAIYTDGEVWSTKGLADLPPPNSHNLKSFDKLFIFMPGNDVDGQLPVAEAAPGNPNYNGGRWSTQTVVWNIPDPPVVRSYDEIETHAMLGDLTNTMGGDYFECPLLPVK